MRLRVLLPPAALLVCVALAGAAQKAPDAAALAKEGKDLYRQGSCATAIPKLDAALSAGAQDPEALFMAGACYKQVHDNAGKERELKTRAVPLLETRIAAGGTLADHYYLASIQAETLSDKSKGAETARKGIALVTGPKAPAPKTPMDRFMLGRLYGLAGDGARAAEHLGEYVKLAGKPAPGMDSAPYEAALESVASHRMAGKDYKAAAEAYTSLLSVDQSDDQVRNMAARSLLLAGDPLKAASVWRGAQSDEMRTEFMYFSNVVTRYVKSGSPKTSTLAPDPSSLSDEALVAKIRQAGQSFATLRTAYMKEKKDKEDEVRAAINAKMEAKKNLTPEQIKERIEAKKKERQAQLDKPDPNKPIWQQMHELNQAEVIPQMEVPEPPEMKAAARDFYFLMTEYVKRGHLLRDFSFQYGLMDLIFR